MMMKLDLCQFGLCYLLVVLSCWSNDAVAFVCSTPGPNARKGTSSSSNNKIMGRRSMKNHLEQVAAVIQPLRAGASDEKDTTTKATGSRESDVTNDEDSTDDYYYLQLLQDAIDRNSTEASSVVLSKISELRQSDDPNKQVVIESFLNYLLTNGPDAKLPFWTRLRPLARLSKRVRLRSLRRTLDAFTPDSVDRQNDTPESQLQRRRRALVSLIRTLFEENDDIKQKSMPAIVVLEKKAIKASKESASDLRSRLPEGLETPEYDVLESSSNIEIRSYKPYSVCTVSMTKPRQASSKTDAKIGSPELGGASSFGALAGYLFGKNDQSTAMKMTTPVFTTNPGEAATTASSEHDEKKDDDNDDERMEFVLPSDYWGEGNLSKAPLPLETSGVTLKQRESETRAILMFGGYASKKETEKRKKELLSTLSKRDSKFKPIETTLSLAQYNDPFTVPWRRLNEVSVLVVEER